MDAKETETAGELAVYKYSVKSTENLQQIVNKLDKDFVMLYKEFEKKNVHK